MSASSGFAGLFESGRVVDLILGLMVVEAIGLLLIRSRSARGPAPLDILFNLVPGACLLVALRAGLTGLPWTWVALALIGALLGHLVDLGRRWRLTVID